jgi:hypothetical protein
MRRIILSALAASVVSAASAGITPIGPFTGNAQEGFETQTPGQFVSQLTCFGGLATCNQIGGSQGLHITSGWGYYVSIGPHGGTYFMGGTSQVTASWEFNPPVARFGGYFGTNYQVPGATATIYGAGGANLGTYPIQSPQGSYAWDGWEANGGDVITRVDITNAANSGHIMHDDLELGSGGGSQCKWDLNGDGKVCQEDLGILLAGYGTIYNQSDLGGLLAEYGICGDPC